MGKLFPIRGAHPPRVRFDAPRVEQLADEASAGTRGARVLPKFKFFCADFIWFVRINSRSALAAGKFVYVFAAPEIPGAVTGNSPINPARAASEGQGYRYRNVTNGRHSYCRKIITHPSYQGARHYIRRI